MQMTEDLLHGEGFTEVPYVEKKTNIEGLQALASGEGDIAQNCLGPTTYTSHISTGEFSEVKIVRSARVTPSPSCAYITIVTLLLGIFVCLGGLLEPNHAQQPTNLPEQKPNISPRWGVGYQYSEEAGQWQYEGFHHDALRVAARILRAHGKLSYVSDEELEKYTQFGILFADWPWAGRPGEPSASLFPGAMHRIWTPSPIPTPPPLRHDATWSFCLGLIEPRLSVEMRLRVFPEHIFDRTNPHLRLDWNGKLTAPDNTRTIDQSTAVDNLLHYPNSSPILLVTPNAGADLIVCEATVEAMGLREVPLTKLNVSAMEYGAVLYQLARKFWPSNATMPEISQLPLKRDMGEVYLKDQTLKLPATYLGGQPFICFTDPGQSTPTYDTCQSGAPSWPAWVVKTPFDFTQQTMDRIQRELRNPMPRKSVETALVYLGWAIHMMHDLATPVHQSDTTGDFHEWWERSAGALWRAGVWNETHEAVVTSDPVLRQILDAPDPQNTDICNSLGLSWQLPQDSLAPWMVLGRFEDTRNAIFPLPFSPGPAVPVPDFPSQQLMYIIRAVRDTALLLACFADNTLGQTSTCTQVPTLRPSLTPLFGAVAPEHQVSCDGGFTFRATAADTSKYSYSLQRYTNGVWQFVRGFGGDEFADPKSSFTIDAPASPADGGTSRYRLCAANDCGELCSDQELILRHNSQSNVCTSSGLGGTSPSIEEILQLQCALCYQHNCPACQHLHGGTGGIIHRRASSRESLPSRESVLKLGAGQSSRPRLLEITFLRVEEDSRCPKSVTCTWEGNARVRFEVSTPEKHTEIVLNTVSRHEQFPHSAVVGDYTIELVELAPWPQAEQPIDPSEYVATLHVAGR
jgi:hypothetical protein